MLSQKEKLYAKIFAERTKRSSNFTNKEVKLLLQLVDIRKDVIESKKLDRTTSEKKLKAWLEIEEEFNVAFEDYRSYKVLKTKYDNLKKSLKRNLTENVSNIDLLKKMQSSISELEDTQFSDYNHNANTDDEDTYCKSNATDIKIKPRSPLNENELNAAEEEFMFENLLFGDTQTSGSRKETNSIRQTECDTQQESNKTTTDIWEQVAHKKLRKLDLEMNVIEEEWNMRKRKLEMEIENIKIENQFKEEKFKLELELLRNQFPNKNGT